jgi:hypothetical protein
VLPSDRSGADPITRCNKGSLLLITPPTPTLAPPQHGADRTLTDDLLFREP